MLLFAYRNLPVVKNQLVFLLVLAVDSFCARTWGEPHNNKKGHAAFRRVAPARGTTDEIEHAQARFLSLVAVPGHGPG
ncbi:hypothetical protein EMIT0P253_250003 [Pseudomonas sp. IT-P253]